MHFTWLTPHGAYRATTCRERELTLDHIHTFLQHRDMEGHPGWGISSMPGPPPRQHEHERRYSPFMHPFILTSRILKLDYDDQIIFGDFEGLKLPDICRTGEEKTRKKNLTQETCPDRGSNTVPLRERRACYRLLHSGEYSLSLSYVITFWHTLLFAKLFSSLCTCRKNDICLRTFVK